MKRHDERKTPWYSSKTVLAGLALLVWGILEQVFAWIHAGGMDWNALGKALAGAVVTWGRSSSSIKVIEWGIAKFGPHEPEDNEP